MAVKRQKLYRTPRVASLGLCLTLACGLIIYMASVPPPSDQSAEQHMSDWLGRTFSQLGNELRAFLHAPKLPGRRAPASEEAGRPIDPAAALGLDLTGLREALALYKSGEVAAGDAVARTARDPLVRATLAWAALRALPHDTGLERMMAFLTAHPDWPSRDVIAHRMEEILYVDNASPQTTARVLAERAPETVFGTLALARQFRSEGDEADAQRLVRTLWRATDLGQALEVRVKSEFGTEFDKDDYRARAEYLFYHDDAEGSLRAASVAGPPMVALVKLANAAQAGSASDKMLAAAPKPLQTTSLYAFAKAEKLIHAEKFKDAANVLLSAPRDAGRRANGDDWWIAERQLARKLLDIGEPALAYRLCAEHDARTDPLRIETEFEAGWIGLRFLDDAASAGQHFDRAALLAETPISIARAAYWQGRAAEASHDNDLRARAKAYYETAAAQSATYYGQLARERLGLTGVPLRNLTDAASGQARSEAIRIVELLYALGEKDLATMIAATIAQHETSESQLAALVKIVAAQRDAHASLTIGKILAQRRIPADTLAFPTYGVPDFIPVENSASPAVVYAIARQESAFDTKAISSAGAKGLMQMIAATAKRTADRIGLAFDQEKLTSDAAFNAKLGAAHLGELLAQEKGCPILAFAAYNAGGHRVKQWIEAYGDPRSPNVDPIDWVERIPFTETRNYVQRVIENLTIYQARFGEAPHREMLREVNAKL